MSETTIKVKCVKCRGKGKVPFSVANGICFDCNGTGYSLDTKEAIEKRELESEKKWHEYTQTEEYKLGQLENEYDDLIGSLQHSEKASEWDSNFAYSIRGRNRGRLSIKQKEVILKIAKKLLTTEEQNRLSELLINN